MNTTYCRVLLSNTHLWWNVSPVSDIVGSGADPFHDRLDVEDAYGDTDTGRADEEEEDDDDEDEGEDDDDDEEEGGVCRGRTGDVGVEEAEGGEFDEVGVEEEDDDCLEDDEDDEDLGFVSLDRFFLRSEERRLCSSFEVGGACGTTLRLVAL